MNGVQKSLIRREKKVFDSEKGGEWSKKKSKTGLERNKLRTIQKRMIYG